MYVLSGIRVHNHLDIELIIMILFTGNALTRDSTTSTNVSPVENSPFPKPFFILRSVKRVKP